MGEAVSRLPVGGEKEKTCRRHIQSPHICETWQVGHQIEYGGTTLCIAAGDDVPGGFMQRNPRRFDGPDPAASNRYGVDHRVYREPQLCHDPVHAHSPGRDHFFGPTARGHSRPRQGPLQPHAGHDSWSSSSTWAGAGAGVVSASSRSGLGGSPVTARPGSHSVPDGSSAPNGRSATAS